MTVFLVLREISGCLHGFFLVSLPVNVSRHTPSHHLILVSPLGAGESGKSTILKQMKLIYSQGFNKHERLEWKPVIFNNIIQSFRTIFEAMTELEFAFDNADNEVCFFLASAPAAIPRYSAASS